MLDLSEDRLIDRQVPEICGLLQKNPFRLKINYEVLCTETSSSREKKKFLLNVNTRFALLEMEPELLLEIWKVLLPCLLAEGSK